MCVNRFMNNKSWNFIVLAHITLVVFSDEAIYACACVIGMAI